jgi:hypothetical protein
MHDRKFSFILTFSIAAAISLVVSREARSQESKHYVTAVQAKTFKDSELLKFEPYPPSEEKKPRKWYLDFEADCGITLSIENLPYYERRKRAFLIADIANLRRRIQTYPVALRGIDRWDSEAERRIASLSALADQAATIAESSDPPRKKILKAKPLLLQADKISQAMARTARVEYEDGCGAGPEDSEVVKFSITPTPKRAMYILDMDFDACRTVLKDPYDEKKCESWSSLKTAGDSYSGTYKYRITWADGSVSDGRFKALGTSPKIVEIKK